jgi:hypothetical protein
MNCEHEWIESIRCAQCGQAIESRIAVGRMLEEARKELAELRAKFAGPRCEVCGSLCLDLAKDELGQCPDCAQLGREIAAAGVHT